MGLNVTPSRDTRLNVRWLNKIVALGLLLLWMPATSLCLIERTGWLAHDDCCPSSSAKTPPCKPSNESPCCALASASYKSHFHERLTPKAPVFVLLAIVTAADPDEWLTLSAFVSETPSPLELPTTWQFSLRTALPPRAPSFVS
jgi:hypothetical protein